MYYKLHDFVEQHKDKLDWHVISQNSKSFYILKQNNIDLTKYKKTLYGISDYFDKNINEIYLIELSQKQNSAAIHIIEQNLDKFDWYCWYYLSKNPAAIHILEQHQNKIDWEFLSQNPAAIHLLEKKSTQH